MTDVVHIIADLDRSPDLHLARLLILLSVFADDDRGSIEGLTKLAKLDFLLRYPAMLVRALEARQASVRAVAIEPHEEQSVESAMVRYRFGPWDHRYRKFLNILVAKRLASVNVEGRKVVVSATAFGRETATLLCEEPSFEIYAQRAKVIKRHFDLSATSLMRFVYETFPEILSLRSNTEISV